MDDHWLHPHDEADNPVTNFVLLICIGVLIALAAGIYPTPT